MFYRIIKTPPGYELDQKYIVAAYETRDARSMSYNLIRDDGTLFTATLEEARQMMPSNAKPVSIEPDGQFLELWEA
jgi:hypothetical protein